MNLIKINTNTEFPLKGYELIYDETGLPLGYGHIERPSEMTEHEFERWLDDAVDSLAEHDGLLCCDDTGDLFAARTIYLSSGPVIAVWARVRPVTERKDDPAVRMMCIREMSSYADRDAYISDLALSSVWGDGDDADIPPERIAYLASLWDAEHMTVKDISDATSKSCRKLAEQFGIPYRTMEDWSRGVRTPPDYVMRMMREILGV